ncbi:MAG: trypsin-like peptidase domain-containing protein [Chloroflexota bacterium]|nr:S1C family serine protease [Dehalococcoidia bacterium]MDW8253498.1 trypsin-like peptidase domain-containing protein [Chloroflexota bacterium]
MLRNRVAVALITSTVLLSQPFGTEARWLPALPAAAPRVGGVEGRIDAMAIAQAARPAVVRVFAYVDLPGAPEPILVGQGSGMIIDERGHVLTNNHVVVDGEYFVVTLADGSRHDARLIGRDTRSDIAVLGVAVDGIAPLRFGDSNALTIGQEVVAIGYAVGQPETPAARAGAIIALDSRIFAGEVELAGLIRSNIPLYPGDSGGPLLDEAGMVVGINAAILTRRLGRTETSFSIPVSRVVPVIDSLIAYGRVIRPTLGVFGVAASHDGDPTRGLLLTRVPDGSPAAAAGLQVGDIIIAVDDVPVATLDDLDSLLARRAVGEQVVVEYRAQADGQRVRVKLTLSEAP